MNFKPAWLELYEAAVLETDNVALQKRIEQAEQALAARLVQMKQGEDGNLSERSIVEKVAAALQVLRQERLSSSGVGNQRADVQH
jgi:hypothetical protein